MSKDFVFFALVAWLVALTVADVYVKYGVVQSIGQSAEKWNYGYVEQDLYYKRTSDNWQNLYNTCQVMRELEANHTGRVVERVK